MYTYKHIYEHIYMYTKVAADGRSTMHYVAMSSSCDICQWLLLDPEMKAHNVYLELEKTTFRQNETVLHTLAKVCRLLEYSHDVYRVTKNSHVM